MPDSHDVDKPSKSELKRQMLALQKLGEQLLTLPRGELDRLALPDQLVDALLLAQRIKSREGRRRQLQYIGKLMRTIDAEPIQRVIEQRETGHREKNQQFHALEQLRDTLIAGDNADLDQALTSYPHADRSRLSQLVRTARKERDREQAPRAARKLFHYLRELEELQQHEATANPGETDGHF